MKHVILKAQPGNWNAVFEILSACADWLSGQGMSHWQGWYTKERVQQKVQESDVYLIYEDNTPVGTISLSTNPPSYYTDSDRNFWSDTNAPAMYVSGLAVLPSKHGKGLATSLLNFAEEKAREKGIRYIRFDTVSHHKELTVFYLKRGYRITGKRMGRSGELSFFEKAP